MRVSRTFKYALLALVCLLVFYSTSMAQYSEKWSKYMGPLLSGAYAWDGSSTSSDVNCDGVPDVFVSYLANETITQYLVIDGADQQLLWIGEPGFSIWQIGNTDSDGDMELTMYETEYLDPGWVCNFKIVDAQSGVEEWSRTVAGTIPQLVDIDNDNICEIIFRDGEYVRCYEYTGQSDVEDNGSRNGALPRELGVTQNYPNPFNPATTIEYEIPSRGHVTVTIYNITGQIVDVPVDEEQAAGIHSFVWHGVNTRQNQLASGVYFYCVKAGSEAQSKKMILLK